MRTLLLTVHIIGVAAWLGANFVQLVLLPHFARRGTEAQLAWTEASMWLGKTYYNAAGALIGLSGVALVLHGDWGWGRGFIWVGIATLAIGGVVGSVVFAPLMGKLRAQIAESHDDRAAETRITIRKVALIDTGLIVLTMVAMISKWAA